MLGLKLRPAGPGAPVRVWLVLEIEILTIIGALGKPEKFSPDKI
jgi:hypothetical protein